MEKKSRDPRTDPKSGDKLRIWYGSNIPWTRKVIVRGSHVVGYVTAGGFERLMPLERWIEQMKNAEVIHVAE